MIIFHNPGLIPIDAVRLMGASVKQAGSFGRFGTGFKYAVATILRGGGDVRIWRGDQELGFQLRVCELKGEQFEEVCLTEPTRDADKRALGFDLASEPVPLGFTTQLGRDWEPWMALRELACNARDEGGDFRVSDMTAVPPCFSAKDDETVIVVEWPEMDEAARQDVAGVFVPATEPLAVVGGVRILPGPSPYLYHRGVRVWKLPKTSVYTYDILDRVELTEDRTVKYAFVALSNARNALLACEERDVIRGAVTAGKDRWEGGWDWAGEEWAPTQPGQPWLEVVAEMRAQNIDASISDSARNVLLKHQAFHKARASSWIDSEGANELLSEAAERLEDIGFDLKDVNVFITDVLPGGALSAVNKGSVFLSQELLSARLSVIVRELIRRLLEHQSGGDHDALLNAAVGRLFDVVLKGDYSLKRDQERFLEDARAGSVADALLIAMDVRGEEFPARPSELVDPVDIMAATATDGDPDTPF